MAGNRPRRSKQVHRAILPTHSVLDTPAISQGAVVDVVRYIIRQPVVGYIRNQPGLVYGHVKGVELGDREFDGVQPDFSRQAPMSEKAQP